MRKINSFVGNIKCEVKKQEKKNQSFGSSYVQNYAPLPVYMQIPYGIKQSNFIKLGVEKLPNGKELHLYKLPNGQNVEILKGESNSSIMTQVGVGGLDEDSFPKGIAHFVEHSMFHSSKKYKDIEKECDLISTMNNASTTDYSTKYYMNLATDSLEDLKKALDIQSDMLLNPEFSKIAKEKNIVKAEIQDDENSELALLDSKIKQHILGFNQEACVDIAGTCTDIDKLTLDDLARFHKKFYQPHNFNTVIVTKHNPDDVIKIVADLFMSKTPKEYIPIERKRHIPTFEPKRVDLISKESNIGHCEFSFPVQNANITEETKIMALIKLLDKRYNVFATHTMLHNGISQIYLDAGNLKASGVDEKYQFISQILQEIYLNPPTEEEIEEIKNEVSKDINEMLNGSNVSQMNAVLSNFNNGNYNSIGEQLNIIQRLSRNDLIDALKYFNLKTASIMVIHPKDANSEEILKQSKNPKVLNNPIYIPGNFQRNNYQFVSQVEQNSGKKINLTTLNNNSKLIIVDSCDDKCEINWKLDSGSNYSSNPATKLILKNMPNKNLAKTHAIFPFQDCIDFSANCEVDEIETKINTMKRFSNLSFTQKDFEEAKRKALEDLELQEVRYEDDLDEFLFGQKYTYNIEFLKLQIEKMTLQDLINDFNGMIANSHSTILVKAPIAKNPALMNEFANNFDSFDFKFQTLNPIKKSTPSYDYDCMLRIDNASQNTILEHYYFPISGNIKDKYTFELLAQILAKKNFDLIREKDGLAYYSGAQYESKGYGGNIYLATDLNCTNSNNVKKTLDAYKYNISEIKSKNITQEEIIFAKNKLKGTITEQFTRSDLFDFCIMNNFNHVAELENISQISSVIDSITIEDIQNAANYVFNNKPRYFINATEQALKVNQELFNSFGKTEKRIN